MEILIFVYLVSFILVNVCILIDAKKTWYSNGEVVVGFVISLIPVINTMFSVAGLFQVTNLGKWFKKPFFIRPE